MKNDTNAREKFIQAIQNDPMLLGFVFNIKAVGLDFLTENGTLILQYHNRKTGYFALLDPAKPTIHIHNTKTKENFNIPIKTAISIIIELYGTPEVIEIPKIITNFPLDRIPPHLKNSP